MTNSNNQEDFFGKLYAHKRFVFRSGDRIFIKQLVLHAKNIVDQNGSMALDTLSQTFQMIKQKLKHAQHRILEAMRNHICLKKCC